MPAVHLVGGSRTCGAKTVAQGNKTVYINNKLVAVDGDPDDHGNGALIASGTGNVTIGGKKVVVKGDSAQPDDQKHPNPAAADGSSNVSIGA